MSYIERHVSRLPGEPNEEALPGEPQIVTTDTHDNMERHNFETLWGQPPTPAGPGIASPGFSPIPARADHVHPGGTGSGTPRITFNRVPTVATALSNHAWVGFPETKPAKGHRFLGWSAMLDTPGTSNTVVAIYQNDSQKFSFTFASGETRKYFEQPTTGTQIDGYSWGATATPSQWAVWSCAIITAGTGAAGLVVELWFGPIALP